MLPATICTPASILLLFPVPVSSAPADGGDASLYYQVQDWTTQEGLPHNSVWDIHQSADGYLWLATLDGLVRFDGVRYTVYNRAGGPGLSSNRFRSLHASPDGILWCGTEDGGLTRFDGSRFTSWSVDAGLPAAQIRGVQGDSAGGIWVATLTGVMEKTADGFRQVPLPPDATRSFGAGPGKGSGFCDLSGNRVLRMVRGVPERYEVPVGLPGGEATGVAEDQHGCFWIATAGAGIFRYRDGVLLDRPAGMPEGPIPLRSALDDRHGNVWITTRDGRAGVSRHGGWYPFSGEEASPARAGLVMFEDNEGSIWMGTTVGLRRYTPRLVGSVSTAEGLSHPEVYPMLEDRNGRIWIGTNGGGLNVLENGRIAVIDRIEGRPVVNVTALAEDRHGRVYIGTVRQGLFRFETGNFRDLTRSLGIDDEIIRDVLEDDAGVLWIASSRGLLQAGPDGVRRFDRDAGFLSDDVRVLRPSREGGLWIGTYDGLVHWRDGRFRTWTEADGLPSSQIRALHEDDEGRLWIGTYDRGLGCLQDGEFTGIGTAQGLGDNGVFQILDDGRGNFWFGSNRGIHRSPRAELEAFVRGTIPSVSSLKLDARDGMLNPECNGGSQPAGFRARDGRLWFPTMAGAAIVDPDMEDSGRPLPRPVLEEVHIDNRRLAGIPERLVIQPGQTHVELAYSAPSYARPEQIRFRYRLFGMSDTWIEAGARRSAIFTHLSPGTYEFQLLAGVSGMQSGEPARLSVQVLPSFWRRPWFLSLITAVAVGSGLGIYERRRRHLLAMERIREDFARRLLQSQEEERKRIAGALHDGLGQTLVIIKNRALLARNSSEDTRRVLEQVEEISDAASQGLTEVREMAFALRPHHLDQLGLSRAVGSLVEKAAAASGIHFTLSLAPIDGRIPDDIEIGLYRIAQEGVSNILKHSGAQRARVELAGTGTGLRLVIADEGRGIASPPGAAGGAGGFGLPGIAERVRLLGGRHQVESNPGSGTTITVWFDLGGRTHVE